MNCFADMLISVYQEALASKTPAVVEAARYYLRGVADGLSWANADTPPNKKPIYCPPPTMILNDANYNDILEKEIRVMIADRRFDQYFVAEVLLQGLKRTFPC